MEVYVIRCGDHHRIDLVFHSVEHDAEIFEEFHVGKLLNHLSRFFHHVTMIDVGDGNYIFMQHITDVVRSLPAEPDHRNVEFFIWRSSSGNC